MAAWNRWNSEKSKYFHAGKQHAPLCSIRWLGEIRGGKKRGNKWKTEFVRGFEGETCACMSCRWEQVMYYKKLCGFSTGFLLHSSYIPAFHLVPYIAQMFSWNIFIHIQKHEYNSDGAIWNKFSFKKVKLS